MDKKSSILQAASQLFCELGYDATTTREIARLSGANMAMINYYFGSKEGVFMEVMNERISGFMIQLKTIEGEDISSIEKLNRIIDSYVNRVLKNPSFYKLLYREISLSQRPIVYKKIVEAIERNFLIIENVIHEGIKNGSFNPIDVSMLIVSIKGTISQVVLSSNSILSNFRAYDADGQEDNSLLIDRTISYLISLTTVYLTTKNDTQTL